MAYDETTAGPPPAKSDPGTTDDSSVTAGNLWEEPWSNGTPDDASADALNDMHHRVTQDHMGRAAGQSESRVTAAYPYRDVDGTLLCTVQRIEPGPDGQSKTFRTDWHRVGAPHVPYRLPEVLTAIANGSTTVYVTEGEKDADALAAKGVVATCCGAGDWTDAHSEHLRYASEVVVIADKDEAGYRKAEQAAQSLERAGVLVSVVEAAVGNDVSDHLAAGLGVAELVACDPQAGRREGRVRALEQRLEDSEEAKARIAAKQLAALESDEGYAERAARFAANVLSSEQLDDMKDRVSLIDSVQGVNTLVRTWGAPKTLKSFVTLDKAACVSLGIPWCGFATKQTTTLYVVAEGSGGMKDRKQAWEKEHGCRMAVAFYPKPVQIGDPEQLRDLIAYCVVKKVGYVIFDTQARCTVGRDENSNTDMGVVIDALDVLREKTGACIELIHHSGVNGKRGRGASAFDGAVDSEFKTVRKNHEPVVKLVTVYQKDMSDRVDDMEFTVHEVANSIVLRQVGRSGSGAVDVPKVTPLQLAALRVMDEYGQGGVSPTDLGKECDKARGHMQKVAEALVKKGLAQHRNRRYVVAGMGWHVLNETAQETPLPDADEP
ncbi:AAA family ATPase [Streptomyces lunaelactis]|uniref:AAA family ATPase n=1 Tax=Streptomyces lunaelactis TaxID=1535768 RepID=UPI00158594CD|nr:AAA family ATPase [Streptomyces lunaelactis]NUK01783.1 AAA family ATPase [Streptomyces lunaelactis]NUK14981.1 AAA family ATPase [Streptomyces lunaelactis]